MPKRAAFYIVLLSCLMINYAARTQNNFSTSPIVGNWTQVDLGRELTIQPASNGSLDVRFASDNSGTLVGTMHAGAGVRVKVGGLTCYYRIATTDDGQRAEWELREGDQACFKGTFSRVVSSASSADDVQREPNSLDSMIGEWTPSNSDKTMEILQNDSGALSLKRSGYALANLSWATQSGSNAHLQSEGLNCYYIVTFDNMFETMRWRMRSGTAKCLDGLFSRTPEPLRSASKSAGATEITPWWPNSQWYVP